MSEIVVNANNSMDKFLENLKEKIRTDIASMLPDDVVASMAKKVVEDEFFTKKKVNKGSQWNSNWTEEPTAFQVMIMEASKPMLNEAVKQFLIDNPKMIEEQINQVLANGLQGILVELMKKFIADAIRENPYIITQAIQR